jgi:hypothetical protein
MASNLRYVVGQEVDPMRAVCRCGSPILSSPLGERTCMKCGATCCSACAFSLDSATYCSRCAESILDAQGVPLALSTQAGPPWLRGGNGPDPLRPSSSRADVAQWLILVARDQVDLFSHLVRAFSRDDKVQILMDRRKDYSRNPPGMEERLRTHGAAVIRRRTA